MSRTRMPSLSLCLFLSVAHGQTVNLSGTVVDAEEGNGLNTVKVALARAGLGGTSIKNGTWSIAGQTSMGGRSIAAEPNRTSGLRVDGDRLFLRLDGRDHLGRVLPSAEPALSMGASARVSAAPLDTLIFTRDGFTTRRVPLASLVQPGRVDSLRRIRGSEWVDSSHSNGFKPDTADAFPKTLRTVTLRISKPNWDRMMKAMADSCGPYGSPTQCSTSNIDHIDNAALIWVPGDLETDGQVWKNVGIRLKGNGSLEGAWSRRETNFPFRVTMDKFEDSFPTIKNQRFHGFKKLSFYNASQDASDIREAVAGEIFRSAGVPASMSVPVRFKLVHGEVAQDLGPYSLVEVPDNPLLNRLFGNDTGSLYKPLSQLNTFVQSEFYDEDLKTDYADVKQLLNAVNAPTRKTAPATWRADLEKVIDMRGWIKWLAISDAIGNWDEYGVYPHNYYLYNDKGLLRWITYDLGWSLVDLDDELIWHKTPNGEGFVFPLVDNVMSDPVYCAEYRTQISAAIADNGPFSAASFRERVQRYGKMVSSMPSTAAAVSALSTYTDRRHPLIRSALAGHSCSQP